MNTTNLFTVLAVLFFAFLSCASALPTPFEPRAPTPGPRSLLGRTYLQHTAVTPSSALPSAVLSAENTFVGRTERFQTIQRRRVARAEHETKEAALDPRAAPQLHVYPAEEEFQETGQVGQPHQERGALFASEV